MSVIDVYQGHAQEYDKWFEKNPSAYNAELRAVRSLLGPVNCPAVEIGAGSGRFAAPLEINTGVEPSENMARFALQRGVRVVRGVAEAIPFKSASFGIVLMVTVICFVDDIHETFCEALRVLHKRGRIIIGMIDKESPHAHEYLEKRRDSLFYKEANFYAAGDILEIMRQTGFKEFSFSQTIFNNPAECSSDEPVKPGYGEGLFAVLCGTKV
ncbi:MAG: class I SAM-dependent methyltransferase [Deltaproteobacteria bacterium]|nr:class I SAM-dependent methyltransferase [Deltaproteobacteria bacterium]